MGGAPDRLQKIPVVTDRQDTYTIEHKVKVKVKVYYPTLTAPLRISPSSDDSTAS